MAQIRHTLKLIREDQPPSESSPSWIDTSGRVWGWDRHADRRAMYLALQYRALLPQIRHWRSHYSEYRDATSQDMTELARWLQERRPLPRWLARVGWRRFFQHVMKHEPSETAIFLLAHRHRYSPHTVRRYITRFSQDHRLLSLIACAAQYVNPDACTDANDYWRACLHHVVTRLKPHAARLPRPWAATLQSCEEPLNPDARYFSR